MKKSIIVGDNAYEVTRQEIENLYRSDIISYEKYCVMIKKFRKKDAINF